MLGWPDEFRLSRRIRIQSYGTSNLRLIPVTIRKFEPGPFHLIPRACSNHIMAYNGNIGSLLTSDFAVYQREDHSKRIPKIIGQYAKHGVLPSVREL